MERALDIKLLFPTAKDLVYLLETKVTDIFYSTSKTFHDEGLYSTTTFGTVGSEERNLVFSYKKLGVKLIHPKLYKHLITLDAKFEKIIQGKIFVVFDEKSGQFVESNISDGFTGITYFIKHLKNVKLIKNESDSRNEAIDMIENAISKNKYLVENFYIIPAGLREYHIAENGRDEEDEINDFYKAIIRLSNLIINSNISEDTQDVVDPTIVKLQKTLVEIYDYIMTLLDGKKKAIRGSMLSKTIDGGTRNVFSSIPVEITDLDDEDSYVGFNDTIMGLYQFIISFNELTRYHLNDLILNQIINIETGVAKLVNTKTNNIESVNLSRKDLDNWSSVAGLINVMGKLESDANKDIEIMVGKHYLLLVEDMDDKLYIRFNNEDVTDKTKVRPIKYGELFMIIAMLIKDKVVTNVSRHPITSQNSLYPSKIVPFSTVKTVRKTVVITTDLGTKEIVVPKFPIPGLTWINTLAPHYTKLAALVADFDGDKGQSHGLYSVESNDEVRGRMNDVAHYIKPDGGPTNSLSDKISSLVVSAMTK